MDNAIDQRLSHFKEFKIYSDLTQKFINFYKEFRNDFKKKFNKQKDAMKRKALLIRLASITTTMRYDEEWRATHFRVGTDSEDNNNDKTLQELQQKFRQLLLKLNIVLHTNAEKNYFQHQIFWYHFYSKVSFQFIKS